MDFWGFWVQGFEVLGVRGFRFWVGGVEVWGTRFRVGGFQALLARLEKLHLVPWDRQGISWKLPIHGVDAGLYST